MLYLQAGLDKPTLKNRSSLPSRDLAREPSTALLWLASRLSHFDHHIPTRILKGVGEPGGV